MRTLSQGPYSVRYKGSWLYSAALGFAPRRWLAIKGLLVMSTWLLYIKLLSKDPWRHISELKFLKMRLLDRNNWNNMTFWMIFFFSSTECSYRLVHWGPLKSAGITLEMIPDFSYRKTIKTSFYCLEMYEPISEFKLNCKINFFFSFDISANSRRECH